uniref:Mitochondrial carrier protein n=1 Tax=Daucus carota subsp. sativus TaxID=79200 RepID=A0A161ZPP2_DAUCS
MLMIFLTVFTFQIRRCWVLRLDKTKFYAVGAGIFSGITVALYPISVVKTRLQVVSKNSTERNAFSVIRGLLKAEGIPGLYRGFSTVITGAIPARVIFLTALETTKVAAFSVVEPLKVSEPTQAAIANGVAGLAASLLSQAVVVPIDVYVGECYLHEYCSWKMQSFIRETIVAQGHGSESDSPPPSQWEIMSVQTGGGIFAGATASCITTPLDTIKTRLQVMGNERRPTTKQVIKQLIADDGWLGLYRGLGPRFFSMSLWGTSMILAYEFLSKATFFSFVLNFAFTQGCLCRGLMDDDTYP